MQIMTVRSALKNWQRVQKADADAAGKVADADKPLLHQLYPKPKLALALNPFKRPPG